MILDTLNSANSILLDSIQVKNDKQAAKNFKDQIIHLNTLTSQLEPLLNIIEELKEKNIISIAISTDAKETLQNAIDTCGEKTYNHTLDISSVQTLKSAIELCRTIVENRWKNNATRKCEDVVNSLSSLRGLLSNNQEVDDILVSLNKAKATMPYSAKGIGVFLAKVARGKEIIDNLHVVPEVEKFIAKVKAQKATVRDLSPEVIKWLTDSKLLDVVKVRF